MFMYKYTLCAKALIFRVRADSLSTSSKEFWFCVHIHDVEYLQYVPKHGRTFPSFETYLPSQTLGSESAIT